MKVVHLCLGCFYPDNYSYQENMLPKFHKQLGYDVEVIASLVTFDKNGKGTFLSKGSTYLNEFGIKVTRLDYKKPIKVYRKLKRYIGTYDALEKSRPDILFIHGCQFMDMNIIVKYLKKHPNVKVYVDNHADFSNSATNILSKNILHKILWKRAAHMIEPYTTKFYGVLPARVDFLKNIYKLPSNKCELLVMGANDELVNKYCNMEKRKEIRKELNVNDDDFVIVTGGKIDKFKLQTLLLMNAVKNMKNKKVKLLIFGSVSLEIKKDFDELCDEETIRYLGWANEEEAYKYFSIADLVVFPGRHSVYWEQVTAMGIPMVCKYWKGTTHIDIGENVKFLKEDNTEEIQKIIEKIVKNNDIYQNMKYNAMKDSRKNFLYSKIAEKSIE